MCIRDRNRIRFVGVSDDFLCYDDSPSARLGIYYYEMGAAPRKPTSLDDRDVYKRQGL